MAKRSPRVPIPLLIMIAVLFILGIAANYAIQAMATPEQLTQNILLSAVPFILIFIAIVLAFIALVVFVGSLLSGKIAPRPYRVVEAITIAGIIAGILGIFQQWIMELYAFGFIALLISTLAFILWSHVQPKRALLYEE